MRTDTDIRTPIMTDYVNRDRWNWFATSAVFYRTIASTIRGGSAPAHPSVLIADITEGPREARHFDQRDYCRDAEKIDKTRLPTLTKHRRVAKAR